MQEAEFHRGCAEGKPRLHLLPFPLLAHSRESIMGDLLSACQGSTGWARLSIPGGQSSSSVFHETSKLREDRVYIGE